MQNNDFIYNKIEECLLACTLLSDKHPQLTHIHAAIENVRKRMTEPMQLAIVGRISSSKSTLVNAILGKPEVVRTGHEAETFNVSWLKYGDDKSPIYYHTGGRFGVRPISGEQQYNRLTLLAGFKA